MKKLFYSMGFLLWCFSTALYPKNAIITENEVKELKLDHISNKFRAYTKNSNVKIREIITNPLQNIGILKNRQTFIKTLIKNEKIHQSVHKLLRIIKNNEKVLEDVNNQQIKILYPHNAVLLKLFSYNSFTLSAWNACSFATTTFYVITKLGILGFIKELAFLDDGIYKTFSFKRAIEFGWGEIIKQHQFWKKHDEYDHRGKEYGFFKLIQLAYSHNIYHKFLEKYKSAPKFLAFFPAVLPVIFYDIKLLDSLSTMKQNIEKLYNAIIFLKNQVWRLHNLTKTSKFLVGLVSKLNNADIVFPEINEILEALKLNKTMNLITNLSKNDISLFHVGKLLYVYQEFLKEIPLFQKLHTLVEKIDAYLAVATMVKASQNTGYPFCFVEFNDNDKSAYIRAENLWNPLVGTNSIKQTIELSIENTQKMMITGPNGSGKSGYLAQVGMLSVFAQSFGIAPAESCTTTPFSYIRTSLDPKGDLEKGISKFMQQKNQAQEMQHLADVENHDFCLFLLDEMFSGTIHSEAEKRIKDFALSLANNVHVLCLITTHLEKPTELGQITAGNWKNYYVEVIAQEKNFIRTYLLKPGIMFWWFHDEKLRGKYVDWVEVNK